MSKYEQPYLINESALEMFMKAQIGVLHTYDPTSYLGKNSRLIENQSADFLENYINGTAILTEEGEKMMPDFLLILKRSSYSRIHKLLHKAHQKCKANAIILHKDEELRNSFAPTKFKILQNKKAMLRLSSRNMLALSENLAQVTDYSTKRLKDQLSSYAILKIEKTLKGELTIDDGFVKLVQTYGTYSQKNLVINRMKRNQALLRSLGTENQAQSNKTKKNNFFSKWGKRIFKTCRKALVVGGIAVVSLIGGKTLLNSLNTASTDKAPEKDKIETSYIPKQNADITPIIEQDTIAPEVQNAMDVLAKAYKERFDSALEIHLGAEKRDQLYKQIDKLANDGKIEYIDGTTREWYAHAFTMYAKVAPNSEANKLITNLFAGKNVDKDAINNLVIAAKRDGTGISGTGTYSAFDVAPKEVQKKHIQNRRNVTNLEKMAQYSR